MTTIALVVDNDVCNLLYFDNSNPVKDRYLIGLSSNPVFIKSNNYPTIKIGDYYINNNFYHYDDLENPVEETIGLNAQHGTSFFAIANDKIFGILTISYAVPEHDLIVAGMSSNPICVDASEYENIEIGWTWNGEIFSPPQGQ